MSCLPNKEKFTSSFHLNQPIPKKINKIKNLNEQLKSRNEMKNIVKASSLIQPSKIPNKRNKNTAFSKLLSKTSKLSSPNP